MTDLIQRIEAAKEPRRELFEEAFALLFPKPAPGCEPTWRPENPKQPIYHAWKTREVGFRAMLDAQAWTSAAGMLVPDGWRPYDADMSVKGRTRYTIEGPKTLWAVNEDGEQCAGSDWYKNGVAAHPSLALLAAILRAERKDDE